MQPIIYKTSPNAAFDTNTGELKNLLSSFFTIDLTGEELLILYSLFVVFFFLIDLTLELILKYTFPINSTVTAKSAI